MKFAKYWKQQPVQLDRPVFEETDGSQTEFSVWGASNINATEAANNAAARAEQFKRFAKHDFSRQQDYEYSNGYIKEEVLEEITAADGSALAVITRNSYGASVLNTESVLFGDIDVVELGFIARIMVMLGAVKKDKDYYLKMLIDYQEHRPELAMRVYETYAGLRFLITHKTYRADDLEVKKMFTELGVDSLYARLCQQQSCFRARLTPKPWRIGMSRPASRYPRDELEQQDFCHWLHRYILKSNPCVTVKLLKMLGQTSVHSDVQRVIDVHDKIACGMGKLG
jgi:hypothetical protein